jgi:hypothetical protein
LSIEVKLYSRHMFFTELTDRKRKKEGGREGRKK